MLVHSCYVDNGFGDKVDILDENGYLIFFWLILYSFEFEGA